MRGIFPARPLGPWICSDLLAKIETREKSAYLLLFRAFFAFKLTLIHWASSGILSRSKAPVR